MKTIRLLLTLFFSLIVVGCGGSSRPRPAPLSTRPSKPPIEVAPTVERAPWDLWSYGQDLEGQSLIDSAIRDGDGLLQRGDLAAAYQAYSSINRSLLSPSSNGALVVRMGSALLSLGRYREALDLISGFFAANGQGAEAVNGHFAVLLAYGYGAIGDFDQSLAWFARTDATVAPSSIFSTAAQMGARKLIAMIPPEQIDPVIAKWRSDAFAGPLLDREQRLRTAPDYVAPLRMAAFWKLENGAEPEMDSAAQVPSDESRKVGVILPLTGPLGTLGVATRNGMEMALQLEAEKRVTVVYKDDQGDPALAANAAKELIEKDKVAVVVGSLLSDPALAVKGVTQRTRVPQLSLSKSNTFETAERVFRLGATSNSQVDTLLDVCASKFGMTDFALVAPESAVGAEYSTAFKKYLNAKGLMLAYEATYAPGDASKLSIIASDLEKIKIQGLFIPDTVSGARELLGLFNDEFRDRVRPLGPVMWDDPTQLANSQAIFRRALFVSPFFRGGRSSFVAPFVDGFSQRFGSKPDFLAAQGFDAMLLAIRGLQRSFQESRPFEIAFKNIDRLDGLTGGLSVDVSGEIYRSYAIVEVADGALRIVDGHVEQPLENSQVGPSLSVDVPPQGRSQ